VAPKVLHKAFNGIFNAHFFKSKKTLKNVKNVARIKNVKNVFYIYALDSAYGNALLLAY